MGARKTHVWMMLGLMVLAVSGCAGSLPLQDQQPTVANGESCAGTAEIGSVVGLLAQSCIDKDRTCTLYGTPCCAGLVCAGRFPNTTCTEAK